MHAHLLLVSLPRVCVSHGSSSLGRAWKEPSSQTMSSTLLRKCLTSPFLFQSCRCYSNVASQLGVLTYPSCSLWHPVTHCQPVRSELLVLLTHSPAQNSPKGLPTGYDVLSDIAPPLTPRLVFYCSPGARATELAS